MKKVPLTAKQQRFVDEYLKDLNATQAAKRAGYSAKTAQEQGSRLLSNVMVAAVVAQGQKKLADKAGVTAEKIVAELAKLGFSNMSDYLSVNSEGSPYVDLSALDHDKWAAVGEVTVDHINKRDGEETRTVERVKFKLADKRAALVDLGKHLGMFVDRHEHTGSEELLDALAAAGERARSVRRR